MCSPIRSMETSVTGLCTPHNRMTRPVKETHVTVIGESRRKLSRWVKLSPHFDICEYENLSARTLMSHTFNIIQWRLPAISNPLHVLFRHMFWLILGHSLRPSKPIQRRWHYQALCKISAPLTAHIRVRKEGHKYSFHISSVTWSATREVTLMIRTICAKMPIWEDSMHV